MKNIHMFGSEGSWGRFVFQNEIKVDWHDKVQSAADNKQKEREDFYGKIGEEKQNLKKEVDTGKLQKEYVFKTAAGQGREAYLSVQLAEFFGEKVPRDANGKVKGTGWDVAGHKKTFHALNYITENFTDFNVDKPNTFEGYKMVIKDGTDGKIDIVKVEVKTTKTPPLTEAPKKGVDNLSDDDLNNQKRIKELEAEVFKLNKALEDCDDEDECEELKKKIADLENELEGKELSPEALEKLKHELLVVEVNNEQDALGGRYKAHEEILNDRIKNRKREEFPLFPKVGDGINVIVKQKHGGSRFLFGKTLNGLNRRNIEGLSAEDLKNLGTTKEMAFTILNDLTPTSEHKKVFEQQKLIREILTLEEVRKLKRATKVREEYKKKFGEDPRKEIRLHRELMARMKQPTGTTPSTGKKTQSYKPSQTAEKQLTSSEIKRNDFKRTIEKKILEFMKEQEEGHPLSGEILSGPGSSDIKQEKPFRIYDGYLELRMRRGIDNKKVFKMSEVENSTFSKEKEMVSWLNNQENWKAMKRAITIASLKSKSQ